MYRRTTDLEYVQLTAEGRYLTGALEDVPESFVEECCDLCEEPGTNDDPLGHFKHPQRFGDQVIAHGQCGEDRELELA